MLPAGHPEPARRPRHSNVFGFPAYGRGPFERAGIRATVPLLVGYLLVCFLEVIAGWFVWRGSKAGAILAIALLPFGAIYWCGFALPIGPVFAVVRPVLIVSSWSELK